MNGGSPVSVQYYAALFRLADMDFREFGLCALR
jgi:hypothetical protein